MITKAEIQNIDYGTNKCVIRIPLFETAASTNPFIIESPISMTPGLYNGYNVGDIVFVGFEEDEPDKPVMLGKLYLNDLDELNNSGGAINGATLNIRSKAKLPKETEISGLTNLGLSKYDTLYKIIDKINKLDSAKEDATALAYLTIVHGFVLEDAVRYNYQFAINTKQIYGPEKDADLTNSNITTLCSNILLSISNLSYGYPIQYFFWEADAPSSYSLDYSVIQLKDTDLILGCSDKSKLNISIDTETITGIQSVSTIV